jgi:hypothetical protein
MKQATLRASKLPDSPQWEVQMSSEFSKFRLILWLAQACSGCYGLLSDTVNFTYYSLVLTLYTQV